MIKNLKASEIAQQLDLPDGSAVVLLDRLAKGRRFSKEEQARNIFAVDANGNLLWQVHSRFDAEGNPFTKLHFENDTFMKSVNLAKWNIYAVALQDLTLFTFSKLKANFNYQDIEKAKEIFLKILDDETSNKMPIDIIENAKKSFDERLQNINWDNYHNDLPFNSSALSLYKWAPIAEDLKSLDRKIVLNSVILKWGVVQKEFNERIKF